MIKQANKTVQKCLKKMHDGSNTKKVFDLKLRGNSKKKRKTKTNIGRVG
jgi:hypothetical protein